MRSKLPLPCELKAYQSKLLTRTAMALTIKTETLKATTSPTFEALRNRYSHRSSDDEIAVDPLCLSRDDLNELLQACRGDGESKNRRALESIITALEGDFDKPVSSFPAFGRVLLQYLKSNRIDGWIYRRGHDGNLYPGLVTAIKEVKSEKNSDRPPSLLLQISWYGFGEYSHSKKVYGTQLTALNFEPNEVARRSVAKTLADRDIYHETHELKQEYLEQLTRFKEVVDGQFGNQFKATGRAVRMESYSYSDRNLEIAGHKLIHDLPDSECDAYGAEVESPLFEDDQFGLLPEIPVQRYFDLSLQDFIWIHANNVEPYKYDKELPKKMVLPEDHRDLLDILTTDISAFTSDIVEGKSAGNIIMCVGSPGLGKTLTAEVYAEVIERPLYSIHAGALGTNADDIEKNLRTILTRAKRWNCVLLLDEADVFVMQRGASLTQNAIVAEFLRTLEYFDGLMFMTSNRGSDIDEAIIPRCAAIIHYDVPEKSDAQKIWKIMGENFGVNIPDELVRSLVNTYPELPPRDIKMLLRLTLRMSVKEQGSGSIPTLDIVRKCAMFRGIERKGKEKAL
ncbi:TPA: AAA family ATPase [Citrobacter freundii]|uniref:AAA family ATPase n=26 Tax=Enterobacteriaceae TaxID=543 RepID=A0A8T3UGA7_ECOLX|nr:ATPase [Citrobacter freundii]AUW08349.1 ATPase [Klebsiella oxytoca]AUZ62802.1 ATPase [Citrobacter sp. CFNIH10]AWL54927.1 ATPase [Klebsiella quasipneumoniae]AXD79522.1 AAA family ATPase [Salmonella enterica]EBF7092996.1 AAA family ATPase [Salmonella enterica subsp. enterica serovar Liverpool]EBH9577409.1 AAA family ATPase [Salmonella enterica subsp. enterica serovar Havana]EBN9829760.1 AAA family ATPase [Salmonella enterica subsp. enterica serovar Senftenberg]EBP4128200.1 AAA family ATPas